MSERHPLLTLVLVLCLAITSVHTAVTRAEARGAQTMVICSDGAARLILLDATGKSVAPHAACPDCVLGGLALEGASAALPLAPAARGSRLACAPDPAARGRDPAESRARGPPAG